MTHPNNEKLEQSCKVLHLQCIYLAGPIFFFRKKDLKFKYSRNFKYSLRYIIILHYLILRTDV